MDTFIVATYDGSTIRQIGPVFDTYGAAACAMTTAVATYNGYDTPTDLPDYKNCEIEGEWKQDGRVWKILGNVKE